MKVVIKIFSFLGYVLLILVIVFGLNPIKIVNAKEISLSELLECEVNTINYDPKNDGNKIDKMKSVLPMHTSLDILYRIGRYVEEFGYKYVGYFNIKFEYCGTSVQDIENKVNEFVAKNKVYYNYGDLNQLFNAINENLRIINVSNPYNVTIKTKSLYLWSNKCNLPIHRIKLIAITIIKNSESIYEVSMTQLSFVPNTENISEKFVDNLLITGQSIRLFLENKKCNE